MFRVRDCLVYSVIYWSIMTGLSFNVAYGRDLSVQLLAQDGSAITIATLHKQDNTFQLQLNDAVFDEHFLSMRPFRCLQGPVQMLCYLNYPYANQRQLSKENLRDLEYDLLFIRKDPKEFGIDAWNGLYYKLQWEQDIITGSLHEVDLNILAVPPGEGVIYPISDADLTPAEPESHWLPKLIIH